ncbi:hypothetical protein [Ferruginibacter sp.]
MIKHCAVDIAPDCNYFLVIENLLNGSLLQNYMMLPNGEGALYSHISINKIIEEEMLHDNFEITTAANSSLKSMSSGEQKKALLQYILTKKPGFIVADNIFDNLDAGAKENISTALLQIAAHTLIIQIINRKKDILPFIETVFSIRENIVFKKETIADYLKENNAGNENYPPDFEHPVLPPVARSGRSPLRGGARKGAPAGSGG